MRPSSSIFGGINNSLKPYEEEKQERFEQWESEITDLIAKIKGSSLKESDKSLALKQIQCKIILNS